ncbi:hypothetical protein PIB30_058800 [Stylosanthes scabra]|uniref:F-box associated domain-containing protein n=1 Tax=Stylosanthes scabra TaxID=79078 RepID=A0ABU6ZIR5_9FABA|nr:hypothetical protein [Stylosanthes scabra]
MSAKRERPFNLPYLGDDVLFMIFVKCHPKIVGRLRTLSKAWSTRLEGKDFVEQNWKENEDRDESVIIGYGYTSDGDKSHWGVAVNADSGEETPMELPVSTVQHGFFTIIGSERGNLCVRFSDNGEEIGVMVWNPVTKHVAEIDDKAHLYQRYSVSVYAFGYLDESWEYRVVYLYKSRYEDINFYWYMWNSIHRCWYSLGNYPTEIKKVGPTHVVVRGVIYWIGWGGLFNLEPTHVLGFSLDDANFFEDEIPVENVLSFHRICKFKKGLGFISYGDVGLDREVNVWSVSANEGKKFLWEKIIHISSFGIPYSPNILKGHDILSVLDTRSTSTSSNDEQMTEVVVSKRKNAAGNRSIIYHEGIQMSIFVKTYTLHRDGLFDV